MFLEPQPKFAKCKEDFFGLRTSQLVYVDKTNFIKEIINSNEKAIVITRPYLWGKTINMETLECFFKIELDKENKPISRSKKKPLFIGGQFKFIDKYDEGKEKKVQLESLNIAKDKEWMTKYEKHFGKYPVIFMDWKSIITNTFGEFLEEMKTIISSLFSSFPEIIANFREKKDSESKKYFSQYESFVKKKSTEEELQNSLCMLVEILHKIHQEKVVILINNYDTPIIDFLCEQIRTVHPRNKKHIKKDKVKVAKFITSMIESLFQEKVQLYKIVLTGIFNVLEKKDFSQPNLIGMFGISDERFSESFGFSLTDIEIWFDKILCPYEGTHQKNIIFQQIMRNLNGFTGLKEKLFHPYFLLAYLKTCSEKREALDFKPTWDFKVIQKIVKIILSIDSSIIKKFFLFDQRIPKIVAIDTNYYLENLDFENIDEKYWSHLFLDCGYLTGKIENDKFHALIPNKLVTETFQEYCKSLNEKKKIQNCYEEMDMTDRKALKNKMEKYLNEVRRRFGQENENLFCNLFVSQYFQSEGEKRHKVSVKLESGAGFIDTLFEPNEYCSNSMIIHEYKVFKNNNKNPSNLLDALWEVYEKNYLKEPLLITGKCTWAKEIVVRPIVIYASNTPEGISLQIDDVIHSIEEAQKISRFFEREKNKDILNINNVSRLSCREALLREYKIEGNIKELLEYIIEEYEEPRAETVNYQGCDESNTISILNKIKEVGQTEIKDEDNTKSILNKIKEVGQTEIKDEDKSEDTSVSETSGSETS